MSAENSNNLTAWIDVLDQALRAACVGEHVVLIVSQRDADELRSLVTHLRVRRDLENAMAADLQQQWYRPLPSVYGRRPSNDPIFRKMEAEADLMELKVEDMRRQLGIKPEGAI